MKWFPIEIHRMKPTEARKKITDTGATAHGAAGGARPVGVPQIASLKKKGKLGGQTKLGECGTLWRPAIFSEGRVCSRKKKESGVHVVQRISAFPCCSRNIKCKAFFGWST